MFTPYTDEPGDLWDDEMSVAEFYASEAFRSYVRETDAAMAVWRAEQATLPEWIPSF